MNETISYHGVSPTTQEKKADQGRFKPYFLEYSDYVILI